MFVPLCLWVRLLRCPQRELMIYGLCTQSLMETKTWLCHTEIAARKLIQKLVHLRIGTSRLIKIGGSLEGMKNLAD